MNSKKLGEILLEEDVLTKRQLQKAIDLQKSGDNRKIGEILIELGFLTIEDMTEVMMDQASHAQDEVQKGKRDLVLQQQIFKSKIKTPKPAAPKTVTHTPTPVAPTPQPIDISEDAIMKTKFKLDLKTIIAAAVGISSLVGMWYALQADIQEAKELPSLKSLYEAEYPSRREGYNWPRSYEQYKDNVEGLQDEMDEAYEKIEELEETIKELEKEIKSLERRKRDK